MLSWKEVSYDNPLVLIIIVTFVNGWKLHKLILPWDRKKILENIADDFTFSIITWECHGAPAATAPFLKSAQSVPRRSHGVLTGDWLLWKALLHKTATFVPHFEWPENWPGCSVVAHTPKVLFLCNCCRTTLMRSLNHQNYYIGTAVRAKEAEWRQNHCHGGSRIAVVAEWKHKGDTMVVQGRQKHRSNRYIMFTMFSTHFFYGRPLCIAPPPPPPPPPLPVQKAILATALMLPH